MTVRVLLWSPGFLGEVGGIETLALPMVRSMHGHGFEFRIMATSTPFPDERTLTWRGVTVHSLPLYEALAAKDLTTYVKLRRRVREIETEFDPHVVHINHHHPGLVVHADTMASRRAAIVYTAHGWGFLTSEGSSHESLIGHLIRKADWVVGCAQSAVDAVRVVIPEIRDRSSLIRNGVPPQDVLPTPLPWDPPVLLCLGRLVEQKGFDTALRALALFEASDRPRLLIAGHGGERDNLAALIDELGLQDHATILGQVEPADVPALINRTTALLMPSRGWEGLPLVAVEAALMGRPLIASSLPGLEEAVVNGETGIVIPSDDPVALAQAIGYLLAHREEAEMLGRQARTRVMREFSWDKYVRAYGELYERLAAGEGRGKARGTLPAG